MSRSFDLWGVPFDGGAALGWPGARYAPDRVRRALSWMLMREEDGMVRVVDVGQDLPMPEIEDRGDVEVVPHDLVATIDATSEAVEESVRTGRVPLVVGGEDSLFFPSVRGFHDAVDGSVGVIHFDAHFDLLDESRSQGRHSHSSGMRRSLELERVSAERCVQVGTRTFNFPSSAAFVEEAGLLQIPAVEVHEQGVERMTERIADRVAGADHVFWSFDIDVIDPAHAPGAGAHEPGGLTSRQALDFARLLSPRCDGFGVMEVNPMMDFRDMTSTLAAYLVFTFAVHGA
ncbi:MAG TPA: arginase family protein [Actinomycetota bacterium]|nr:arginase family protein [Actinomycetota bacterium]